MARRSADAQLHACQPNGPALNSWAQGMADCNPRGGNATDWIWSAVFQLMLDPLYTPRGVEPVSGTLFWENPWWDSTYFSIAISISMAKANSQIPSTTYFSIANSTLVLPRPKTVTLNQGPSVPVVWIGWCQNGRQNGAAQNNSFVSP